jgi:hypothetical protein
MCSRCRSRCASACLICLVVEEALRWGSFASVQHHKPAVTWMQTGIDPLTDCMQEEQHQQEVEKDAGLIRELLAAAMHSRAAYGYAMQVSRHCWACACQLARC